MIERLRYDFDDKGNPTLEVPQSVFDVATSEDSKIPQILELPDGLVKLEQGEGGVQLVYTMDKLAKVRKKYSSASGIDESMASQWYYTLGLIEQKSPDELDDLAMSVEYSNGPLQDSSGMGRRGMSARLKWPIEDVEEAGRVATEVMQRSAVQFGYLKKFIANAAFAIVTSNEGVQLQALDMGCCCLMSDGWVDASSADKIELHGHNLYNRQVMLTCLNGLVALARQHD